MRTDRHNARSDLVPVVMRHKSTRWTRRAPAIVDLVGAGPRATGHRRNRGLNTRIEGMPAYDLLIAGKSMMPRSLL
jgi:hypothetical protein